MRVNKLILEDFKFFYGRNTFEFGGKNVLIYGENGSGKSSIYWALYTFMQSSTKNDNDIKKYFDLHNPQNLINRFSNSPHANIKIELIDNEKRTKSYTISSDIINTNISTDTTIKESNLSSDFINYRLLSRLYDFRNSEDIDLFEVFEKEILDYISFDTIDNVGEEWQRLKKGLEPRPTMRSQTYKDFQVSIRQFNDKYERFLNEILENTNRFLRNDFKIPINLIWRYKQATYDDFVPGSTTKRNHKTIPPKIIIKAESSEDGANIDIPKPHTFLNEAKLTAIALSIRLSILKYRLSTAPFKILVLDDLLISLDMSNRVTVSNIIFEHFSDYQIIVLTHDKGFYGYLKRVTGDGSWRYFELYSKENKPIIKEGIDNIEKAKRLFENHEYEAAANFLRKEAEETLKYFLDPELKYINKEFKSLEELLKKARQKFEQEHLKLFKKSLKKENFPIDLIDKIDTDFETNTDLTEQQKGLLRDLKRDVLKFTKSAYQDKLFIDSIFDELKDIKDRILNPGSHYSEAPVFRKELEDALKTVKHLKEAVRSKIQYRIAARR